MQNESDILKLFRGQSQGGVDDEAADAGGDTAVADDYTPEGGVAYTGADDEPAQPLDDADFEDEATDDTPADDKADTGEAPKADDAKQPAADPVAELRQQLQAEREERLKLQGMLEQFNKQPAQKPAEQQKEARKYQQALDAYVADGGDKEVAGRLQTIFDAFYEDIAPEIGTLKQHAEYSQQHLMQQQALAEKRDAEGAMRQQYGATDAELAQAEKDAQAYYAKVARGEAAFREYGELYERSILRQKHQGGQKASNDDKLAEQQRLEAQRRANPTKGESRGKAGMPELPSGDFNELKAAMRKQGLLVDG